MVLHAGLAPATTSAVETPATEAATTETSATEATSTKAAETLLAASGKAPTFSAMAEAAKWARAETWIATVEAATEALIRTAAICKTRMAAIVAATIPVIPAAAPIVTTTKPDSTSPPVEPPGRPSPAKSPKRTEAKPDAEIEAGAVIPNTGNPHPTGPRSDGIAVCDPRIVCGDVDDLGVRIFGFDCDVAVLVLNLDLVVAFEDFVAFRLAAHFLNRVRNVSGLIVVGVAQFGGPGKICG